MTSAVLQRLARAGVSVWLDGLDRDRLTGGLLAGLVRYRQITGVTAGAAHLTRALTESTAYDQDLVLLAALGADPGQAARELAVEDTRSACDLLLPVHRASDGRDGHVCLPLDPRLARDPDASLAEARRLWHRTGRPNALLTVPATAQGTAVVRAATAEGISTGATALFSVRRYEQVADAYLDGLEAALDAGRDLARIASVAAFAVGRVDAAVDALLARAGSREARAMRGTAALAGAALAHEQFTARFTGPRFARLARHGARPQRLLWTSTAVRTKAVRDTRYVERLIAPGTVTTLPESTLLAMADHGSVVRQRWTHETYDDARHLLRHIETFGVDLAGVLDRLEDEALKQSEERLRHLLDTVAQALETRT